MREIGVRDLKAHLSDVLREVARGEQIRVTVRGRVIADLVPAGPREGDVRIRALVAEGRITPASRSIPRRAPRKVSSERSATAVVLAERDEEG